MTALCIESAFLLFGFLPLFWGPVLRLFSANQDAAYEGFGSGILKAETLPYVAHQREFPEAGPCLISTISNGIIKLAVCSRNHQHI